MLIIIYAIMIISNKISALHIYFLIFINRSKIWKTFVNWQVLEQIKQVFHKTQLMSLCHLYSFLKTISFEWIFVRACTPHSQITMGKYRNSPREKGKSAWNDMKKEDLFNETPMHNIDSEEYVCVW